MKFETPKHIFEPTDLQCGQAALAMLLSEPVDEIIALCGTDRETKLADMYKVLDYYNIKYSKTRKQVENKSELPKICILSLQTPRCWHWSLYFDGVFYDPEHGVSSDFPECQRKYCWEIFED